jgi:hypothetical protein
MLGSSLAGREAAAETSHDRQSKVKRRWAAFRAQLASVKGRRVASLPYPGSEFPTPPILNPHIRREAR